MKWFVILTVIAILVALGLPPDSEAVRELHTSAGAYRLAVAALLIPYTLIWYLGFYTYAKLHEYSAPLKKTRDGAAFRKITFGMGVLAFSLVVPTIIELVLSNIAAHNKSFEPAAVIINNYLGLFPGLIAFLLLYNGARMLVRTTSGRGHRLDLRWYSPFFFLLAIIFSHLTIENLYHSHPYHLSVWMLVVTFIVPFLYAWMVGLLSAYDLQLYARTVKGSLYQRAVKQFAAGISVVIIGSISIQFVNVTVANRSDKSLGTILAVDYGLLLIVAVGLILMAIGTKKLKLIEEI